MRKDLYEEMFRQEKYYWWHMVRRQLILAIVGQPQNKYKIFDAGCGTGALINDLQKKGFQCWGGDFSPESLKFCQKRGIKNPKLIDFEKRLPFKASFFDKVTCLDVLEHVENEKQFLSEFKRILKPGGKLYITVPAYSFLWSYWDEMLGHKRRYEKSEVVRVLNSSGFEICRSSYFFSFMLPQAIIFRLFKSFTKSRGSDFVQIPRWLNSILLILSRIERFFVARSLIPFGLSVFVEASKAK